VTGHPGDVLMRWPWRREAKPIESKLKAYPKVLELQTAKEILEEVLGAGPCFRQIQPKQYY